ncbi:hypothetical protein SAMN05444355_1089 [Flavobacterium frigoris]|uniref:Uncharacterized protein n=1 Tax=Flavobacterium frigoris TaxID=229204 RepID=A0A1H9MB74_FLAFI|nr:hypothetical protein SAMN05444355_1089 [Flavobacterium frigoris]
MEKQSTFCYANLGNDFVILLYICATTLHYENQS